MKMKPSFFLSGAIALMLATSTMVPAFTEVAVAGPGRAGGSGMKFDQLNLTDAQKTQLQQIKESTRQQMDAVLTPQQQEQKRLAKEQRQRPNLNLTEDQQSRIQAIRQSSKSQMEAVLTPEQRQQLQTLQQQWRQRRQQQ